MTDEETKKKAIEMIQNCSDKDDYMVFTLREAGERMDYGHMYHASYTGRATIFAKFHAMMAVSGDDNE